MKKQRSFWGDLENYTWKMVGRVSPALPYLAIAIIGVVIISSLRAMRGSVASAHDLREATIIAAKVGDYSKADELWNTQASIINNQSVLGIESELEELVYPERVIERDIEKYEDLLIEYPGNRDIYVALSKLYREIGNEERSAENWESARILDPNNELFAEQ